MGNESSSLNGLEIEEQATEITDFWVHYQAKVNDSCSYFSLKGDGSVSVFKGEAIMGPLWAVSTPLEKFSNNLLKYRHPCIIRYISAWQQRSTLHLATEYVQPLSQVISCHNPLQICIGLNNILRALVFLHEQAEMSHNNISVSAIYVSGDGQWKLGGLQYLCSFQELNPAYLKHAKIHRYDKAIDPNEDSYEVCNKVDQYAFATLVEDVYKGYSDDSVPYLKEFKEYCSLYLQNSDITQRPTFSEVLEHSFFNHEFISIYNFLYFISLKSEDKKSAFFSNILNRLRNYDEEIVGKLLGGHLLSRLTLLDDTARKHVIPYIFKPKDERIQNVDNEGFFSLPIFKEHIKPRLLQLFSVRDSQVRLLLLNHFSKFIFVFSHEELSQHILPELLLGIKDVDDNLVASTLVCLSELVPILGADTVVGGKRLKLFTDGRPNSKNNTKNTRVDRSLPSKSLRDFHCSEEVFEVSRHLTIERPSPVGGEATEDQETVVKHKVITGSEDDWSDWDHSNRQTQHIDESVIYDNNIITSNCDTESTSENCKIPIVKPTNNASLLQKAALAAKRQIVDISDLDIKTQKLSQPIKNSDEIDFFADMTPVIEKAAVVDVASTAPVNVNNKFNVVPQSEVDEDEGWGDNWT